MGLLDKLRHRFGSLTGDGSHDAPGGGPSEHDARSVEHPTAAPQGSATGRDPDEAAVERYRYMLRTAPPETVEQAHAEAFAKLTPDQRRKVLEDLGSAVPTSERATSDDPQSLARMATRAEMREPGTIERTLGGGRGGMGMGGMIAGTLLASVAAIADAFLGDEPGNDAMAAENTGSENPGVDPEGGLGNPGMDDFGGIDGGFDV